VPVSTNTKVTKHGYLGVDLTVPNQIGVSRDTSKLTSFFLDPFCARVKCSCGGDVPHKILVLSDLPTSSSGLAKISRELACRINKMEDFEVASYGSGGIASKRFPWPQYELAGPNALAPQNLPEAWTDFAGNERGTLLTIWNPGWLGWLTHPELLPDGKLKNFIQSDPFDVWAYLPLDAEGPDGRVPLGIANIIKRFDRPLAYTQWEADMIDKTIGGNIEHLPHGTDSSIFYPRDRESSRSSLVNLVTEKGDYPIKDGTLMIGVVATNSARKDWQLAFQVGRELVNRGLNIGLWCHTDAYVKYWDIPALIAEYGLDGRVIVSNKHLTDNEVATCFSACDVTFGIGRGEGWGLPLSESLAAGTPVVHGKYAGATEFIPPNMLVEPIALFNDDFYGHQRPVFNVSDWADKTIFAASLGTGKSLLDPKFYWDNCWASWEEWLKRGIAK